MRLKIISHSGSFLTFQPPFAADPKFSCIREVRDAVKVAVDFYNTDRPHMSVDMMTPEEASKYNGEIRKWWKSYREEAIKRGRA